MTNGNTESKCFYYRSTFYYLYDEDIFQELGEINSLIILPKENTEQVPNKLQELGGIKPSQSIIFTYTK